MPSLPTGKPDVTLAALPAGDQQHASNHERPKRERKDGEKRGGAGSGVENVEPRN